MPQSSHNTSRDTGDRASRRNLVQALAPLLRVGNAYQAELAVSALLGGAFAGAEPQRRGEVVAGFAQELTRHLGQVPGPESMITLAGLGLLAPGEAAEQARAAAARIAPALPGAPPWVSQMGQVVCVGARVIRDGYGDLVQYLALFRYPAGPKIAGPDHALWVRVDQNFGVVLESSVATPGATVVEQALAAADRDGVECGEIPPGTLRADLVEAFARTDELPHPPGGAAYHEQWALVRARVLSLPEAGTPSRPTPLSPDERHRLVLDFAASDEGRIESAQGRLERDLVVAAAREAVDYAVEVNSGDPLRWSPASVRIFLLQWLPRLDDVLPEVASWLPEVLDGFVAYAGRVKGLPEPAVTATRRMVAECSGSYTELMHRAATAPQQESAEEIMVRMRADGVDPADEDAARDWLTRYYQEQQGGEDGRG